MVDVDKKAIFFNIFCCSQWLIHFVLTWPPLCVHDQILYDVNIYMGFELHIRTQLKALLKVQRNSIWEEIIWKMYIKYN